MQTIPFPSQYKKVILAKKKNTTIRTSKEIGKYKKGKTYSATSYSGNDWNIKIKIKETTLTTLNKLPDFKIHPQVIASLRKSNNLLENTKVEVIRFEVI